jgi:hypothetical protein
MPQPSLEAIRQAVNSGEFARAQLLWNEYASGLAGEFNGGRLSEAGLAEVREFVEWSRTVVLCERAHLQDQLNRLQRELYRAGEYGMPAPPDGPCIVAARF